MTKWLLGIGLLTLAAPAFAQQGYQPPYGLGVPGYPATTPSVGSYMPNVFNRNQQPLSPYLNLLRGGNPALNYYQGTRPQQMAAQSVPQAAYPIGGASPLRNGFLPAAANPNSEPVELPAAGQPIGSLSPSGHPVSFGRGVMPGGGASAANRPGVLGNKPTGRP